MLKFFLFPFIFFFLTLGSAQKEPYLYVNSSIEMGNRPITSIVKDKNSFLWIGTYGGGLKKFDGIDLLKEQIALDSKKAIKILDK